MVSEFLMGKEMFRTNIKDWNSQQDHLFDIETIFENLGHVAPILFKKKCIYPRSVLNEEFAECA